MKSGMLAADALYAALVCVPSYSEEQAEAEGGVGPAIEVRAIACTV